MKKIVQLSQDSSRLLHSSNIITSVFSVVKELVENSLDARSTIVEIKLENSGLDRIDVRDDGVGVTKENIQFLAKPHYTSKLSKYEDLSEISSYGFRGEALGAICAVGELSVTTKTLMDEYSATYTFLKNGDVSSCRPSASLSGTTVTVKDLFKNIPVRRKYYKCDKHKREEIKKIEDILCAFSCAQIGTRFALYNNQNLIWQKSPASEMSAVLIQLFGNASFVNMEHRMKEYSEERVKIEAYVPKKTSVLNLSRTTNDHCLILINKRPVKVKAIEKLLQDIYCCEDSNGSKKRYPICLIDISLPPPKVDINVDPNKLKVFLHDTENIVQMLSNALSENKDVQCQSEAKSLGNIVEPFVHVSEPIAVVSRESLSFTKTHADRECNKGFHLNSPAQTSVRVSTNCENSTVPSRQANDKQSCAGVPLFGEMHIKQVMEKVNHTNVVANKNQLLERTNMNERICADDNFLNNDCPQTLNCNKVPSDTDGVQKKTESFHGAEKLCISKIGNSKNISANLSINQKNVNSSCSDPAVRQFDLAKRNDISVYCVLEKENFGDASLKPSGKKSALNGVSNGSAIQKDLTSFLNKGIEPVVVYVPPNCKRKSPCPETIKEPSKKVKCQTHLRPMTAFDYFCYEKRLEVISQKSSISNQEIAKILSDQWRLLSEEEKSTYEQKVSKQAQRPQIKLKSSVSFPCKTPKSTSHPKRIDRAEKDEQSEVISFSFDKIASFLKSPKARDKKLETMYEEFNPISSISCGVWICYENKQLILLNTHRIRETLIYHRLMATFHVKADMLSKPIPIMEETLGDSETYHVFLMLCMSETGQFLMNEHIAANGFNIKVSSGAEKLYAEVIGMSSILPSYSLHDLREILYLIKAKGNSASLSEIRPTKVSTYLQGEAARIARQSLPFQMKQEICDILREASAYLPPYTNHCFHNKPFRQTVFDTDELREM